MGKIHVGTRDITRVWRHQQENRAAVEYNLVTDEHVLEQRAADQTLPPAQELHDALDAMYGFIAAPYGISGSEAAKVRTREVKLFRKVGDDGQEVLQVKLYGTRDPDGFDANVSLRIPKQEVTGKLKAAVDKVIAAAIGYIDGARGQVPMGLGD